MLNADTAICFILNIDKQQSPEAINNG